MCTLFYLYFLCNVYMSYLLWCICFLHLREYCQNKQITGVNVSSIWTFLKIVLKNEFSNGHLDASEENIHNTAQLRENSPTHSSLPRLPFYFKSLAISVLGMNGSCKELLGNMNGSMVTKTSSVFLKSAPFYPQVSH